MVVKNDSLLVQAKCFLVYIIIFTAHYNSSYCSKRKIFKVTQNTLFFILNKGTEQLLSIPSFFRRQIHTKRRIARQSITRYDL